MLGVRGAGAGRGGARGAGSAGAGSAGAGGAGGAGAGGARAGARASGARASGAGARASAARAGGAGAGGAGGANPLNQLIAALNLLHQHNQCPIPIFSGLPNEDPSQFKRKALDYMQDALVPPNECTRKFRLCLQGEARDWYNEIAVPVNWDVLMNMFCQ